MNDSNKRTAILIRYYQPILGSMYIYVGVLFDFSSESGRYIWNTRDLFMTGPRRGVSRAFPNFIFYQIDLNVFV